MSRRNNYADCYSCNRRESNSAKTIPGASLGITPPQNDASGIASLLSGLFIANREIGAPGERTVFLSCPCFPVVQTDGN